MEMVLHNQPAQKRVSFKKSRVYTIPNQSMTLKEILQRFMRREALPQSHNGFYSERFGDLEALQREDISVRYDRALDLRRKIKDAQKRMDDKAEASRQAMHKAAVEEAVKAAQAAQAAVPNTLPPTQK